MAIQYPQLNYFKLVIEYPNMVLPSVLISRKVYHVPKQWIWSMFLSGSLL